MTAARSPSATSTSTRARPSRRWRRCSLITAPNGDQRRNSRPRVTRHRRNFSPRSDRRPRCRRPCRRHRPGTAVAKQTAAAAARQAHTFAWLTEVVAAGWSPMALVVVVVVTQEAAAAAAAGAVAGAAAEKGSTTVAAVAATAGVAAAAVKVQRPRGAATDSTAQPAAAAAAAASVPPAASAKTADRLGAQVVATRAMARSVA